MKIALLIPAYCPSPTLINLIRELSASLFEKLIVVNDGSSADYDGIFDELKIITNKLILLKHETNMGKGAALKTGFNYLLQHGGDIDGVVTADADGQHTAEDIMNVAGNSNTRKTIVLGYRHFDGSVPLRSRFGNQTTRKVLKLLFGLDIYDTQTGLRGLSADILPLMARIPYDRYEYELEMLLVCKKNKVSFIEVPISTIYIDNNKSSHFNALVDSTKIYFVLFRYVIASLLTAAVDYLAFILFISMTDNILLSTLMARGVALAVNYSLLRFMVFKVDTGISKSFPKYILLVLAAGFVTAFLISTISRISGINVVVAKMISELTLYPLIFWVQKTIIFTRED